MASQPLSPRVIEELVQAESRSAEREVDRLVADFVEIWGPNCWPEQRQIPAPDVSKPLILVVDSTRELLEIYESVFKPKGYRVTSAWTGKMMLIKNRMLRPQLIVSALNVLRCYPPAYRWMLTNLARHDGVPVLFATAANTHRIQMEIPFSTRARVLQKPFTAKLMLESARKLFDLCPC